MTMFPRLDDIRRRDLARVGGKAFNCARLRQAGFPVPDGLVIPIDVADRAVRGLAADSWFAAGTAGALFAVRSSGVGEDGEGHSFAGVHDTQLNVERDRLTEAVLACRRSAGSAHARAYREARDIGHDDVLIAVLVQQMVPAETSGVAFTINPVTGADELVIESVDGLGEALVSGRVNPDEQLLTKSDPSELAKLIVRIEAFYGAPQDIEWCFDGRQYWIVQSRPVTTGAPPPQTAARPPARQEVEWTRANLAEVLPEQLSPQALEFYCDLLDRGERLYFGRLMAPESELGPIIKPFYGRLYFNLSQLRHVSKVELEPLMIDRKTHAPGFARGPDYARWSKRLGKLAPGITILPERPEASAAVPAAPAGSPPG